MMKKNRISRIVLMCASTVLLFSCDKEVSDVGSEVLTSTDIFRTQIDNVSSGTENISLETIQSNVFTGNRFFGTINRDETSGSVNYSILYRVEPTSSMELTEVASGQTINSIRIQSANLILPYTYDLLDTSNDTIAKYETTNIINEGSALEFDVFRSDFDLVLDNTTSNTRQLYFANASRNTPSGLVSFAEDIEQEEILDEVLDANPNSDEFEVSIAERETDDNGQEIVNNFEAEVISNAFEDDGRVLRVSLDSDFLGEDFASADGMVIDPSLFTTNAFFEKFKGVYLKPKANNANLVSINNTFNRVRPKIEITFAIESSFEAIEGDEETEASPARTETNEVTLDFEMNQDIIVSIVESQNSDSFNQAFGTSETMVIKGGVSASRITLFEDRTEIEEIFDQNPIISSAVLRLYVDVDSPLYNEANIPQNLWINNLENGGLVSGATLVEGEEPFYEFQLTQYLRGVLSVDDAEELLDQNFDFMVGISTSEVNTEIVPQVQVDNSVSQNLLIFDSLQERRVNVGSLLSLEEVPLFGSAASDVSKRPQLSIDFATVD